MAVSPLPGVASARYIIPSLINILWLNDEWAALRLSPEEGVSELARRRKGVSVQSRRTAWQKAERWENRMCIVLKSKWKWLYAMLFFFFLFVRNWMVFFFFFFFFLILWKTKGKEDVGGKNANVKRNIFGILKKKKAARGFLLWLSRLQTWLLSVKMWVRSLASLSGLRIWCGQCGSDLVWLWLWHRLAAGTWILPLAWELLFIAGVAAKKTKPNQKHKKQPGSKYGQSMVRKEKGVGGWKPPKARSHRTCEGWKVVGEKGQDVIDVLKESPWLREDNSKAGREGSREQSRRLWYWFSLEGCETSWGCAGSLVPCRDQLMTNRWLCSLGILPFEVWFFNSCLTGRRRLPGMERIER